MTLRYQQRHSVIKDFLAVSNVKNMDRIAPDMIGASSLLLGNHTGIDVSLHHQVKKREEQSKAQPPVQK
jgi:hypothetical protein